MEYAFDAYVTTALFDGDRAAFALGDGRLVREDGAETQAHEGAILCAAGHPSGDGVLTGGDDGRLVWVREGAATEVADVGGRWIDALAVSADSGLIAFCAGRRVEVRDTADSAFVRVFDHERSVAALAFEPRGRRLAAATYGGVALWYARIREQKPVILRWAGSHIGLAFSPDGKFLLSAMQEAALHGWRLSDAKDMKMGGYPAKIASLAFLDKGAWLATSGAQGVVLWPFVGAGGPMGRQATEVGFDSAAMVTQVAGAPGAGLFVAGRDDGRVWLYEIGGQRTRVLREGGDAPITALALLGRTRVAWGDEAGAAGVIDL